MAVIYDAGSQFPDAQGASTSATWSHTIGNNSDRLLLVCIGYAVIGNVQSVTYNGVACEQVVTGGYNEVIFKLHSPDVGTHDVVVTYTGSNRRALGAVSFYGVQPDDWHNTVFAASDSSVAASYSMASTTAQVAFSVLYYTSADNVSPTVGAGETLCFAAYDDHPSGQKIRLLASYKAGAASTTTITWGNSSTGSWSSSGFAIDVGATYNHFSLTSANGSFALTGQAAGLSKFTYVPRETWIDESINASTCTHE